MTLPKRSSCHIHKDVVISWYLAKLEVKNAHGQDVEGQYFLVLNQGDMTLVSQPVQTPVQGSGSVSKGIGMRMLVQQFASPGSKNAPALEPGEGDVRSR